MTLKEIRALLDAATPGPWHDTSTHTAAIVTRGPLDDGDAFDSYVTVAASDSEPYVVNWSHKSKPESFAQAFADARLIAAAPEALRQLLAVAEAAEALRRANAGETDPATEAARTDICWRNVLRALAALEGK